MIKSMDEHNSTKVAAYVVLAAIISVLTIASCWRNAFAATTHNSDITATLCVSGSTLELKGEAVSWSQELKGSNNNVEVSMSVVNADNSVWQMVIASAQYTTTANNRFGFGYQGLSQDTARVTVFVTAKGTWGDGSTNHPVNDAQAI